MVRVFFTSCWKQNLFEDYSIYTSNNQWGNIKSVNNIEKADFVIAMQGNLAKAQNKKIIFLQREPHQPGKRFADCYYHGTYQKHYHVQTWWIFRPFAELKKLEIPQKPHTLCTIMSGKTIYRGQNLRLMVVNRFLKKYPGILHFYGRDHGGHEQARKKFSEHYKGNIIGRCKLSTLSRYKYSIACENSSIKNYFTEKISDCFLTWTKPLYWGCPNISDYFPEESYTWINAENREEAAEQIKEAIKQPIDYDAIKEARHLVLNKYNIWPSLSRIIQ